MSCIRLSRFVLPALAFLLLPISGCTGTSGGGAVAVGVGQDRDPSAGSEGGTDPTGLLLGRWVHSPHGAVAAASPLAAEVGAWVLAEGGNAVDAAVATGFALGVVEPSMSGLGGRASIMVRSPDGTVHGIDGLNRVPMGFLDGAAPEGVDRAAVPGVPAALDLLLRSHGSWPLVRVLEPAIRLAEEGFLLPGPEAERFASAAEELRRYEGAVGSYLDADGEPPSQGALFRQPELARTLRAMAEEGVEVFYRGWVADSIDAGMRRLGGFVLREEMEAYQALGAIPARGGYRGYGVASNFRPASGHAVIQALHTVQAVYPGGSAGSPVEEARWAAVLAQAMGLAIQDRNLELDGAEADARILTSPMWSEERARQVRVPEFPAVEARVPPRAPPSPTPWNSPAAAGPAAPFHAVGGLVTAPGDLEATSHHSAVDREGWIVAVTQSLGPSMGARVVAPGLGFLYATRLGDEPGSRPSSAIAPTILLDPTGRPILALGGAGNDRIISAVIQVISRVVDHGLSLEEAMAAPRIHPDGDTIRVEEGAWSPEQVELLESWGFPVALAPSGYFGRVHAVVPPGLHGVAVGVAEPRWPGGAAAPQPEVGRFFSPATPPTPPRGSPR